MPRVCVFDVNETLLDLSALDPYFAHVFGDAAARAEWFTQLLQSALVATVTDAYADFSTIGRAALEMTAARRGVTLSDRDRQDVLGAMRQLPPHPEVRESLERLRGPTRQGARPPGRAARRGGRRPARGGRPDP